MSQQEKDRQAKRVQRRPGPNSQRLGRRRVLDCDRVCQSADLRRRPWRAFRAQPSGGVFRHGGVRAVLSVYGRSGGRNHSADARHFAVRVLLRARHGPGAEGGLAGQAVPSRVGHAEHPPTSKPRLPLSARRLQPI